MASNDFLAVVDALTRFDPIQTYPSRGALELARLVGARDFALELQASPAGHASPSSAEAGALEASQGEVGSEPEVDLRESDDANGRRVSFALRHGKHVFGTLTLHCGSAPARDDLRLARFCARMLARGIHYARRLAPTGGGSTLDVRAALDRTPLTPREREVVLLLVSGASTRTIAARTGLTVATVHTYLKRIYPKLGVHSRVELVAKMAGTGG